MEGQLKNGTILTSESGNKYEVVNLLGAGGQGEVYDVKCNGSHYALKWYFKGSATERQKKILETIIAKGSPDESFLWPMELIVPAKSDLYGYIMPLRPKNYKSIVDLMKKRVNPSFYTLCRTAFNLTRGYQKLHAMGAKYQDISFGNLFFNPDNGDVLICDNDNVSFDNSKPGGVLGTPGFMAPEIVRGEKRPSKDTDRYSLSVLLFYLFMVNHPLEGKLEASIRCMDMAARVKLYGTDPVFIFDPNNKTNRPVKGIHDNATIYWPLYPEKLRQMFTRAFGKRSRLEKLDADIKEVEAVVIPLQQQLDEQKKILSIEQEGKEDDEILAWMKQVSIYVKKVQDEVRLCSNTKDEYSRFSNELNETVDNIKIAYEKYHRIDAEQYSADIKKTVQYLYEQLEQYSLLNIYHQIYDESVRVFKETNAIKSITGKCHRYDLYIQLMFAMRYFNKKIGNMQFICVDEGQDLAVNEYRLLLELNQNNVVFNIFGDTNQLMKSGRGIADWSLMMSEFHAEQYVLNENYRNTNQITRFCNDNFGLQTLQTGVDGPKVREIPRRDLEKELAGLKVTTERVAILLPRTVQKMKYLDMDILPENTRKIIGETMDNGFISIMYVDEVKGIEFDKVFVVSAKMRRNEKYIAYTRALSELIIVVDETVVSYDTESDKNQKVNTNKSEKKIRDKNRKSAALKWERKEKKQEVKNIESLSVQVFAGEKAIPFNQIIVEDATRFKKPVQELLENIENYYLKYGKLDLPIWVSVKEGVYVLEDNYAQYVVASKLKLEQVNTICVDGAAKIQENPVTNLSEKEERNLPEVQDEEKEAEQINSELIIHISCIYKNAKNKCYNVNCIENVGKRCTQEEKCVFYIAATEELSVSEENEIEMDIKNAEIYLRNSEIGKHHKIIKSQPEYFEGIRSIPINQIDVPACFKKNRPAEKKIDALLEYYEEHGCLDKPVTVVFRNNKYVLKDKFLRYYVGKMLKLKKIDAICTVD